ncbi:MAG TPA: hypothetical protein PLF32_08840 [Bacteroidales bacterium]|mgnify:CR=1 FL=1|nr:hypothetical protein [Bacteroidales bacterium]HOR82744.1 hypothetical protein [Bacteroidales bacterium]HPJ91958.1 hypothetical protein [Bacteroidales bacterium]
MRHWFFFAFFLVFTHHHLSYTQGRTTTLQENNLRGKVKSIVEYEYAMIDAEGNIDKEMGASGKDYSTYNKTGNIIEYKVTDSKGIVGLKTIYQYENNLRTKENTYNSKNKITERWSAVYNDKKKIKEAYRVFEGNNIEKVFYTYDNKGVLLEEKWLLNNAVSLKVSYTYTDNGRTVEKKTSDASDKVVGVEIRKYNDAGILLEESKFNYKDALKGKTICIYNEKEQLIEEQTYDSLLHLEGKIVFIYDKYGNIAEEKWYDNKNQRTSHIKNTYTYDKSGNWIEKTEYDTEVQFGIIYKRIINYY